MKKDIFWSVFFAAVIVLGCNGGIGDSDDSTIQLYQDTQVKKFFLVGQIAEKIGCKGQNLEYKVKLLLHLLAEHFFSGKNVREISESKALIISSRRQLQRFSIDMRKPCPMDENVREVCITMFVRATRRTLRRVFDIRPKQSAVIRDAFAAYIVEDLAHEVDTIPSIALHSWNFESLESNDLLLNRNVCNVSAVGFEQEYLKNRTKLLKQARASGWDVPQDNAAFRKRKQAALEARERAYKALAKNKNSTECGVNYISYDVD